MDINETIEHMVLDLMVKGTIDQKELRPSFNKLSSELATMEDIRGLLDSLDNALGTPKDSPDINNVFQETLQLLEKLGNWIKEKRISGKGSDQAIPDRLRYNTKSEPEIIESFQLEVSELFEKLEHDLLLLERMPDSEETISAVMGYLHSIKGLAGFLDLEALRKLAHVAESALEVGLENKFATGDICDALLRTKDMFSQLVKMLFSHLNHKERGFRKLPSTYPLLFKELVELDIRDQSSSSKSSDEQKSLAESSAMEAAFLATEEGNAKEGSAEFGDSNLSSSGDHSTKEIVDEIADAPTADGTEVEYEEFTEEDLQSVFGNLITEAEEIANKKLKKEDEKGFPISENEAAPERPHIFDSSDNIRLKLSKLETLLDLIGEVVIAHSQLSHDPALLNVNDLDLERKIAHLTKCTRNLQALGMNLRVFPVRQLFAPLSRTARDLAVKLKKEIKVLRIGEDSELDKSVLQALTDPLMHIIRNAIDHGLETTAERKRLGKPAQSQIRLEAINEGGMARIKVADNGRGLDRVKILQKAKKMGIIHEKEVEALPDEKVWKLIFSPGFSTAASVSEVSGRGVGLDVVQRSVERLGGRILVKSKKGEGTTFTLVLPMTLAMLEGLMVLVEGQKYIVPRSSVSEIMRPRRDQISSVHGHGEMLVLRGETLPLIRLHEFLGTKGEKQDPWEALILVIKTSKTPFALMVDGIAGQQQVVLKSLGEGITNQKGIGGCAILGDGQVGLVLNPEEVRSYVTDTFVHEVA